jgi:hypothetical protein
MTIEEVRSMLEVQVPGAGLVDALECLDTAAKEKEAKLLKDVLGKLASVKKVRLPTAELLEGLRSESLARALGGTETVSMQELSAALSAIMD